MLKNHVQLTYTLLLEWMCVCKYVCPCWSACVEGVACSHKDSKPYTYVLWVMHAYASSWHCQENHNLLLLCTCWCIHMPDVLVLGQARHYIYICVCVCVYYVYIFMSIYIYMYMCVYIYMYYVYIFMSVETVAYSLEVMSFDVWVFTYTVLVVCLSVCCQVHFDRSRAFAVLFTNGNMPFYRFELRIKPDKHDIWRFLIWRSFRWDSLVLKWRFLIWRSCRWDSLDEVA